jgi:hypothetical protein
LVGVAVLVGVGVFVLVGVTVGVGVLVGVTVAVLVGVGVGVAHIQSGLAVAVPLPETIVTLYAHATLNVCWAATIIISVVSLQVKILNVVPVPLAPP